VKGNFQGVFPMLVTPFDHSGDVSLDELAAIAHRQLKAGVAGMSILGLAGESAALTSDERMEIARLVLSIAKGVPVIVGCTAPDTATSIELASDAVQHDAAVIMVAPPSRTEWSVDQLREHYSRVADAIFPTPLMVQDAPAFIGVSLSPEFITELAQCCPNITYAKPESVPAVDAVSQLISLPGMGIFGGHGGLYFLEVLEAGAHGLIPGCAQSKLFQRIFENWTRDDKESARAAFHEALPLLVWQFQSLDCFIASEKILLHAQGLIKQLSLRGRQWPMGNASKRILLNYARRLGIVEMAKE
jgi:dihydrodipicolinate synthase/N-acetylneuraminate lyase